MDAGDPALLAQLQDVDAIMQPKIQDVVSAYVKVGGKREDVVVALAGGYRGTAEACNLLASWMHDVGGIAADEISDTVVQTVANRVRAVYDTNVTRHVFQTSTSRQLPWMEFMVTRAVWRTLLYELHERNKTDQVLGIALHIIEKAGHHQDELATFLLGFKIFNTALVQSIGKLMAPGAGAVELSKFKRMCAQSPNAYLYAQLVLLRSASGGGGGGRVMRLFWELEQLVMAEHPTSRVVPRLGYLLMGLFAGEHQRDLALGIVAMVEARKTNPTDVMKIHRAYTSSTPPPVHYLHNATLLALLVEDLFSPTGHEVPPKHLDKYVFCLAYATSVGGDGDTTRLAPTQRAIETASRVAKENLFGPQLELYMPLLQHYIAAFPVVSMGMLQWIRGNVCDRSYFEKGTHTLSLTRFIGIVVNVCATQVRQRLLCVELVRDAYDTVETAQAVEGLAGEAAQVKGDLLTALVRMMMTGDAAVIAATMQWTESLTARSTTDMAIMRGYLKRLLGSVQGPFAPAFVEYVAALLAFCIPAVQQQQQQQQGASGSTTAYVQSLTRSFLVRRDGNKEESVLDTFLAGAREGHATLSARAKELLALVHERLDPTRGPAAASMPRPAAAASAAGAAAAPASSLIAVVKGPSKITVVRLGSKPAAPAATAAATAKKPQQPPPKAPTKKPETQQKKKTTTTKKKQKRREDYDDGDEDSDAEFELGKSDDDDDNNVDDEPADEEDDDELDSDELAAAASRASSRSGKRGRPVTRGSAKRKPKGETLSIAVPVALLPRKPVVAEKFMDDDDDVELFGADE